MSIDKKYTLAADTVFEEGGWQEQPRYKSLHADKNSVPLTVQRVADNIDRTTTAIQKIEANESPPTTELLKVKTAIEMAKVAGIINHKVMNPSGTISCVVIGTKHLEKTTMAAMPDDEQLEAEVQMFQLLHCFQQTSADTNPLYCEGLKRGSKAVRLNLATDLFRDDLYATASQQYLFQHPRVAKDLLRSLVSQHPEDAGFCLLSAYRNLQGVHDVAMHAKLYHVIKHVLQEQIIAFRTKYDIFGKVAQVIPAKHQSDGKPYLIINGKGYLATEVISDCDNFISGYQSFDANSLEREEELVGTLSQNHGDKVPIAWVGLSHTNRVAEACVKRNFCVHMIHPAVVTAVANDDRIYLLGSDPSNTYSGISQIVKLREMAIQSCQFASKK